MDAQGLHDRVAIVTGSSRGIGRVIALAFADAGARVVVTFEKNAGQAETVAEAIRSRGRRAISVRVDVSSRADVQGMVDRVLEEFGGVDVLVNNAGVLQQKPFPEISGEDWDRVMGVNLKGTFHCSQAVFPVMQKQGSGQIVNIASSGGQLGGDLAVHYSASKAGVICLTKSLARIGAPLIRANCIAPGLIETEMTGPEIGSEAGKAKIRQILLGRPGLAEEVAAISVFLASPQASYITGQTINVNGGLYLG